MRAVIENTENGVFTYGRLYLEGEEIELRSPDDFVDDRMRLIDDSPCKPMLTAKEKRDIIAKTRAELTAKGVIYEEKDLEDISEKIVMGNTKTSNTAKSAKSAKSNKAVN